MSVYGGDSWAKEAQHRKRRVDELMLDGLHASSFKKLSNGKFTCLVCPHHPLLDSSLMLSMHSKGQRHHAALSRLKEKELQKQVEINKRVALSDHPTTSAIPSNRSQTSGSASKPLIEQTRKATSEILHPANAAQSIHPSLSLQPSMKTVSVHHASGLNCEVNSHHSAQTNLPAPSPQRDFRERREMELKFTCAGWKRDCHGKWYRDENVEFDSDEEDPNICLA